MGAFTEQRQFIGQEYDAETGLNYLNARYYDGARGQFISEDPMFWNFDQAWLADPQNQNSYAYARNNPIILSDPTGKSWTTFGQGVGESLVATLIIAGAIAAIPVAIPVAVVTGLAVVGTGAAMYGTYQNYDAYASGQISKDQFDYNSGALLGGLALPYGMGKLAEGGQAVNLSKLGQTRVPNTNVRQIGNLAADHAYEPHILNPKNSVEKAFASNFNSKEALSNYVGDVINSASGKNVRPLENGRTAYWDDSKNAVVIHNSLQPEKSTVFSPSAGKSYFESKLK